MEDLHFLSPDLLNYKFINSVSTISLSKIIVPCALSFLNLFGIAPLKTEINILFERLFCTLMQPEIEK